MAKPSPASMLTFLASGAMLLASSRALHSNCVVIDRAFLAPIIRLSADRGPAWDAAGEVIWKNYDELVYLARTGDADAVRAIQHLFVIGGVPGGCSCSLGELADALFGQGDLPPGFLDQLRGLGAPDQARILGVLDHEFRSAPDARYETWCEERAGYLSGLPGVAALYTAPDFDAQLLDPSPGASADDAGG